LAENPALRRQLGKGARLAVEKDFAEGIIVAETMALYKKALGPGGYQNDT